MFWAAPVGMAREQKSHLTIKSGSAIDVGRSKHNQIQMWRWSIHGEAPNPCSLEGGIDGYTARDLLKCWHVSLRICEPRRIKFDVDMDALVYNENG